MAKQGKKQFCFIDRPHFEHLIALLMVNGSMCPKCGHGTRKTSESWRKCKKCGERLHLVPATGELVDSNARILEAAIAKIEC